jgi:MFS transporter, DHA2 family, multidrug resistance protein
MSSASSPASAAAPLNRPMITISIMLATLIQTLDSTIANVALPHMQGALSASQDEITWVLTSYIVAAAIATPLTGWLSDRLSMKRLLIVAIGGFTVASALCGLSETLTQIVASRLLQGIFGASLVPLSQSILLDINPREKQGQAMAVWGMGVMVGPILGPTLGGWLTDSYNWRWVFFINVPVGAAVLAVTPWLLHESRSELHHRHFDVAGATSVTAGLMLLVYALTRTATSGWGDPTTLAILAASAVLVAGFVAIELRSKAPLLPLRIFRQRTLAAANGIAVIVGAMAFSQFFLLTLYMQQVLHYSAMQTGAGFVVTTLAVVVFSNVGQRLVTRFGIRPVLSTGLLLVAASMALLTQLPAHGNYFWDLFPAFLISGIGMGFTFVPMTIAGLTGVAPADAGVASGLINTTRQIGGAVGLAAVSTIAAASVHPGVSASVAGADLTHGFRTAFDILTGLTLVGVAIAVRYVAAAPRPAAVVVDVPDINIIEHLEEAA